jgi:hypothetical protein
MDPFFLALAFHLEVVDYQRSRVELYCTQPPHEVDLGPPESCGHVPLPHNNESHGVRITVASTTTPIVGPFVVVLK